MGYSTTIPNVGQSLAFTRDPIRNNWSLIQSLITVNHGDFGAADMGKHKFVQMPEQTLTGPATGANEGELYTLEQKSTTEMYWRPESQLAAGDKYQLTTSITTKYTLFGVNILYKAAVAGQISALVGGWSFLPGGLIIQYINFTVVTASSKTIDYLIGPTLIGAASIPYSIQITCTNLPLSASTSSVGTTDFTFTPLAPGARYSVVIIGPYT